MKELSIEEKAKAYDEAIEKFDVILNLDIVKESGTIFADDVRKILPELAESEDEKIRMEIISHLKYLGKYCQESMPNVNEWIAWLEKQVPACLSHDDEIMIRQLTEYFTTGKGLQNTNDTVVGWLADVKRKLEKQGEQKPADKVEPKFHEGDMIIHKELGGDYIHNPHKIIQVDILDKKYRLEGVLVAHFGEQEDYELVEQNPAWSEEDEQYLLVCKNALAKYQVSDKWDATIISQWLENKFKSLRPWLQWKPSDEQMEALDRAQAELCSTEYNKPICDLIDTLNKLKE